MADATWDEVGRHFAELGRQMQRAWEEGRESDAATEARDAGEKVKHALDDVADTINRAVGSPEIHDAARQAGSSLADAVAASLRDMAERIEHGRGGATRDEDGTDVGAGAD